MSSSTPPNWPIHGISLSNSQVLEISKRVFPEGRLDSYTELEKRNSFNNRIYFLSIKSTGREVEDQPAVLKVIGRFFDARKVQNEVASLLTLAKFCPDIPAPRVLAWSEDGTKVTAIRQGVFAVLSDLNIDEAPRFAQSQPWIMISKRPGRILTEDDLASENGGSIAEQLADILKSWRQNIPHREGIGNIKLQPATYTSVNDLYGLEAILSDPILCDTQPQQILKSLREYYDHLLCDQMYKIKSNDIFAHLRPRLLDILQDFRDRTFNKLPCFEEANLLSPKNVSVFTHEDFAPRNILVSPTESGLAVSGIVDFEFSGFFAPEEEFLNSLVRQDSDWPKSFADLLLEKLESRGVQTPSQKQSDRNFELLFQLIKMIENVAPWWLQAGHVKGNELESQLDEACTAVKASMEKLSLSVTSG